MKHTYRTLLGTGLVLAAFLLASCAELTQILDAVDIRQPTVGLEKMAITSLDFEAIGLDLTLTVDNPNPVPVTLSGFDYAVFVEDQQLTAGEQRQGVEIRSRGTSSVHVPVQLRFGDLYALAKGLADATAFGYRVDATALVTVPVLGALSVPAQTSGTLPIPRVPDVKVKGLQVGDLGLTGVDVVVGLEVANPNGFGLDVTGLSYALEVGSQSWLKGALPRVLSLEEGGTSRVDVPVRLNLLEAGKAVSRILGEGGALEYRLHGTMELDTSLPALKGISLPFDRRGSADTYR